MKKALFLLFTLGILMICAPRIVNAATGGTITTIIDGGFNYTIHTFTSNGTFETNTSIIIDALVIAGGGSGGSGYGAGGGAGGVLYNTSINISTNSYNIIVGSGGIRSDNGDAALGNNGSNSNFSNIINAIGGSTGSTNSFLSTCLVSCGGSYTGGGAITTTISGQGHDSGSSASSSSSAYPTGGGGGCGSNGFDSVTPIGGNGGQGCNYTISGASICYAGGGGGNSRTNTGGSATCGGGGGASGIGGYGGNGTANTGGGGGGGNTGATGGNGGSGIVIIRYLTASGENSTINFINPTPANHTSQYAINNDTIKAAVITTNPEGLNTTISLYYHNIFLESVPNSTSHNFTGMGTFPGLYMIRACLINAGGSEVVCTENRSIDIYSITTTITSPADTAKINRTLNLTFSSSINSELGEIIISSQNITLNAYDNANYLLSTRNASIANLSGAITNYIYDTYETNLTIGYWYIILYAYDNNSNYNNKSTYIRINITKDSQVNISAKYQSNNATISNFTINITDETTGETQSQSATNNQTTFEIIKGRNYTITIDAEGYAITNTTHASFTEQYNNYTLYLYTTNSVRITIYDESTLLLLNTTTVSITFQNNITALIYSTSNGTYYKDGLTEGVWSVKFYSANYSYRTYTITVGNRSTQTLNAYLTPSAYTTIFTIRDSQTLATLQDVSFTIERLSNATYIIVESKFSDISGAVQFGYLPGIEYRFTLSKTGYSSKVFSLNPVLFASYNIYIDRISSLNNTLNYGLISIVYYPKTFYNNQTNTLTFQISSPQGVLTAYGISIKAPGGNTSAQGNNAIGETFNLAFNITGATLFDRVNISYNYTSTIGGTKTYYLEYEIIGTGIGGNYTIAGIKTKDYGLGAFEKALLATLALVFIAGFAFLLAGTAGAIAAGLLIMGISVYLGFLPLWSVVISFITGIIILVAVSIGGNK